MKITATVTHKETREVEIPVPSFWKNERGDEFKALLDDNTFMQIAFYHSIKGASIQSTEAEMFKPEIANTHVNFLIISEDEFMSAYADARFQTDLSPMLISKSIEARDAFDKATSHELSETINSVQDEHIQDYQRENA